MIAHGVVNVSLMREQVMRLPSYTYIAWINFLSLDLSVLPSVVLEDNTQMLNISFTVKTIAK